MVEKAPYGRQENRPSEKTAQNRLDGLQRARELAEQFPGDLAIQRLLESLEDEAADKDLFDKTLPPEAE